MKKNGGGGEGERGKRNVAAGNGCQLGRGRPHRRETHLRISVVIFTASLSQQEVENQQCSGFNLFSLEEENTDVVALRQNSAEHPEY